jgi:signal-transduction protein with cAMP-binding, CBS, and nucleotidyltransferase domain
MADSRPPSPAAALAHGVAGAMAPPPPALPPSTPLGEALAALAAARASALLAADEAGRPVGILTEQDIARRVAFRLPPEAPLSAAMTAPVIACREDEQLWRAVALLRAHRLRHLPVLGADGRAVGMLHRAETLAAASGRLLEHLDALAGDDAAVKRAQAGVAAALLAEGVAAPDLVTLVSEINLDLHRRILERTLAAQTEPPPVPFTLLLMGSAGRGESLLRPDQDNGLILGDYPDAEHGAVDAWFRPFATSFNDALAAAGFPLCAGGVMARNPLWRKTLPQWREQLLLWAHRRHGVALLFADIAFDFRAVAEVWPSGSGVRAQAPAGGRTGWGDPAPAPALRAHLHRVLEATPALLAALAQQDQRFGVGLTFWGGFADDEPGPGTRTDLKLHGLMPLVAAARLLALRHGVAATATPARLAGLAEAGSVAPAEAEALRDAFAALLDAVLRQQLADHAAGLTPGNLVDTAALGAAARARLKAGLRAIRSFANTAFVSITGRV